MLFMPDTDWYINFSVYEIEGAFPVFGHDTGVTSGIPDSNENVIHLTNTSWSLTQPGLVVGWNLNVGRLGIVYLQVRYSQEHAFVINADNVGSSYLCANNSPE